MLFLGLALAPEVQLCRTVGLNGPQPASACCPAERNSTSGLQWCCWTAAPRTTATLLCLGMEPGGNGVEPGHDGEVWLSRDLGANDLLKLLARHSGASAAGRPASYYRARLEQTLSDGPACTDTGCSASRTISEELNATIMSAPPAPRPSAGAPPKRAPNPSSEAPPKLSWAPDEQVARAPEPRPLAAERAPPPVRAPRKLTAGSFARR